MVQYAVSRATTRLGVALAKVRRMAHLILLLALFAAHAEPFVKSEKRVELEQEISRSARSSATDIVERILRDPGGACRAFLRHGGLPREWLNVPTFRGYPPRKHRSLIAGCEAPENRPVTLNREMGKRGFTLITHMPNEFFYVPYASPLHDVFVFTQAYSPVPGVVR